MTLLIELGFDDNHGLFAVIRGRNAYFGGHFLFMFCLIGLV